MSDLKLYNTLTRTKEVFKPDDDKNVRMYVCGPTVYDFAHIGNARPVIVFDVLYRLLRHKYDENHVTYVRNITDVDDKINARALRDYPDLPLNEAIRNVTEKTATQFHADVKALGCLEPTHEPRATEHIDAMVSIIQTLLDKDHAYVADGGQGKEVLFRVSSMEQYGTLSNRVGKLNEQQEGARVAVESHKENAGDFVLWKQSKDDEPGWEGRFNGEKIHGRPGWHIECSAMSEAFLGKTFDIHGGGLDLIFPHHENEIAQSRCAHGTDKMANVWMHNGYVQVEGKKMSKSDGNFVTIHDLLHTEKFGGRKWPGEVLRLAMLMTHYREPIDFSVKRLEEAYFLVEKWNLIWGEIDVDDCIPIIDNEYLEVLFDDCDTGSAINYLAEKYKRNTYSLEEQQKLYGSLLILGVVPDIEENLKFIGQAFLATRSVYSELSKIHWHSVVQNTVQAVQEASQSINRAIETLPQAVEVIENNIHEIRSGVSNLSNQLVDARKYRSKGVTAGDLSLVSSSIGLNKLNIKIDERLKLLNDKNFTEADRIRDELLEQGIQLKDGKDPETGERVTTWEVKR